MRNPHDSQDSVKSDRWFVTNGVVAVGPTTYELVLRGVAYGRIPAGSFQMGSEKNPEEKPVHQVRFTYTFFIDNCAITQKQYMAWRWSTYRPWPMSLLRACPTAGWTCS